MLVQEIYLAVIILMRKCTGLEDSLLRDKINSLSVFSFSNGLYPLHIFPASGVMEGVQRQIEKSLVLNSIPVSKWTPNHDHTDIQFILYIYSNSETLELSLIDGLLKLHPNRRCLLLSLEPRESSSPELQELFSNLSSISHFFIIDGAKRVFEIYKLGRFLSPVAERIYFISGVHLKQGIKNLKGISLRMVAMPWYPFSEMNCPLNLSMPCECTGISINIAHSVADLMNFTLECYMEKNNDWGSTIDAKTQNWNGILGDVIKEVYDIGPPLYSLTRSRLPYFDSLKCISSATAGFYFLENSEDPFLLFQPFTIVSWMTIFGVIIVAVGIIIFLQWFDNSYYQSQSFGFLIFSISFLFVVVHAYYGGALTMFFATESIVLFNTLLEVLIDPNWGILFMKGSENAEIDGIALNNEYVDRFKAEVRANPDKYLVLDIEEGLQRAKTTTMVYHHDILSVGSYLGKSNYRRNIYKGYSMTEKKYRSYNFMFKKDSPVPYFLLPGLIHLNNVGVIDKEILNEIRSLTMSPQSNTSFFVLNLLQMASVFYILFIGIGLSIVALLIEVIASKRKEKDSIERLYMRTN